MKINLMEDSFTHEETDAINQCLKSQRYTQGKLVEEFEKNFAEWNNSKYAVMVNSGSSANLLMVSLLKEKFGLKKGDEILVPSVTWPTTVYPIIQNNLSPIFCDVDRSFNIKLDSIKNMTNEKTKAIFAVHLLGQPAKMKEIKKFCKQNNLLCLEDCCESTGAQIDGIKVGNWGLMGSFSFYFGHHMTTIEGGMIVTNDFESQDLLKSMRSHGWIKGSSRTQQYSAFENKNFVFDIMGYNLRSTDINATIGLVQLKKLDSFITKRKANHAYFLNKISQTKITSQEVNLNETSSFSLGILTENKLQRDYLLKNLQSYGIESRPIVAGNLIKQPIFEKKHLKTDILPMANKIHDCGLYLPNNQFIRKKEVDYISKTLEKLLSNEKYGYQ